MRMRKGSLGMTRSSYQNAALSPPWALFSVAVIMQALAPVGPSSVGELMLQPLKLLRSPPAASPWLEVAIGYSSQLRLGRLGASPQASLRLVLTLVGSLVRVSGVVRVAPGSPDAWARVTCEARDG